MVDVVEDLESKNEIESIEENDDDSRNESDSNDDDDYNIIVNVKKLKDIIQNNFFCKHCFKCTQKRRDIELKVRTFGISSELTCTCVSKKLD